MSDLGFNIHQQLGAYKLISLLGKGKSGEVWSAISEVDNQAVALKIFSGGMEAHSKALYEYETATRWSHPNLLKPLALCNWDGHWGMVMPLCVGRSVDGVAGYVQEKHVWQLLHDVSSALSVLHQQGWGHWDVKPSNILWDESQFLLSDFGSSRKVGMDDAEVFVCSDNSSYRFDAPELTRGIQCEASDIWSLGATAFYLFMGCHVFHGLGGRAQKQESVVPCMRKNLPDLSGLIGRCLAYDFRVRPTADEIRELSRQQLEAAKWMKQNRTLKIEGIVLDQVNDTLAFWPEEMRIDKCM